MGVDLFHIYLCSSHLCDMCYHSLLVIGLRSHAFTKMIRRGMGHSIQTAFFWTAKCKAKSLGLELSIKFALGIVYQLRRMGGGEWEAASGRRRVGGGEWAATSGWR